MAILSSIKNAGKKAADFGANIVAGASQLSSAQLRNIEEKRHHFMSEKPETDPEGIKRLLGSYAIEAYEAYLPQIARLYEPIDFSTEDEGNTWNNRIRYFEITKWVSDPSEDSIEKLINVYEVVSNDNCQVALIYNRKKDGCKVYFAIVNMGETDGQQVANALNDRIVSAMKGNFPGAEINPKDGSGILECLNNTQGYSVASVSNIATEKTEDFINQSMEKLLDGICPKSNGEEYTIVLLATPIMEQLSRRNSLAELYSKLAPYSSWQTNFTYTEMQTEGSSAEFGVNLGFSAGRRSAKADITRTEHSDETSNSEIARETEEKYKKEYTQKLQEKTKEIEEKITHEIKAGVEASVESSVEANAGIPMVAKASVKSELRAELETSLKNQLSATFKSVNKSIQGSENGVNTIVSTMKEATKTSKDSESTLRQTGKNGWDLGFNVGADFARTSNVAVTIGKNEGITQTYTNYSIKYTLETIEKQIKRLEESASLGLWDFSAYFISKSPIIANNAAHMYMALTQGNESFLSQSSVNLWAYPTYTEQMAEEKKTEIIKKQNDVNCIIEYIKRFQHPEFQLRELDDAEWLMYPPHVSTTVSLTGREMARALNFPKKSVSGIPVIECTAFGREVHKYELEKDKGKSVDIGCIYHMHQNETARVNLDVKSLASHTFITGSTGTGKSNTVYQLINKIREESKNTHFLVIEPAKGEYKEWFGGLANVFGTNPDVSELLRINPFSFPEKIHVLEHIDRLVEILNACWPMYAAMPAILKDSIERIYVNKGWNLYKNKCCIKDGNKYPTFFDLLVTLPEVMAESSYSSDTKSDYSGALITRIKSLTNGLNGQMLCNGIDGIEIKDEKLFGENTIVDLSRIGSMETKSLFMGILVMKLQEYHLSRDKETNERLNHITILEEAHNLLRKTSFAQSQESANLQGKSVEMLTNSIAEMRTYGEGFVIVDQAPGLLDEAVIRNTNTKIVLRLPDSEDRELVGKAAALNDEQIDEIAKLPMGVAVVYQNNWVEAVLCHFDEYKTKNPYVKKTNSNDDPRELLQKYMFSEKGFSELNREKIALLTSWIDSSKFSRETKLILLKAVGGYQLNKREKQMAAYNLYEGKMVAKLLYGASSEKEGVEKADFYIKTLSDINNDLEVENIRQLIIQALISQDSKSENAKRYLEYSGQVR